MKIGFISDTHTEPYTNWGLSPCDVLIHCGDFSFNGTLIEQLDFIQDFKKAKELTGAKYAICIPGNHECGVQDYESLFKDLCKDNGLICLIHEEIVLDGIKFFGTSYQPFFHGWAYNVLHKTELNKYYQQIPDDTNILITHCPPKGILDYSPTCGSVGSQELLENVYRVYPQVHCFGHIHFSRGIKEENNIKFINAALLDDNYDIRENHDMIVVEYDIKS